MNAMRRTATQVQRVSSGLQPTSPNGSSWISRPVGFRPSSTHRPSTAGLPRIEPKETVQTRFIVTAKPEYRTHSDVERQLHAIFTRLQDILGDVPYGRTEAALSRTPLRVMPAADPRSQGSTIAFKVFNASCEQNDKIIAELSSLPGVEGVRSEGQDRR